MIQVMFLIPHNCATFLDLTHTQTNIYWQPVALFVILAIESVKTELMTNYALSLLGFTQEHDKESTLSTSG